MFAQRTKQYMHVIRHDDKRVQFVAFAIEVKKSSCDQFTQIFLSQDALAVRVIEEFFEAQGELAIVFTEKFFVPRLRVVLFP